MYKAATSILKTAIKNAESQLSKPMAAKAIQRSLLLAEEAYATPLILLLLDCYGPEVLSWAPETIRLELEQDFKLKLPKITLDKIMAAITILTTNYFYKDVTRFVEICNILAGDDFQPDEFEPADASEMLVGITESLLLYPPNEDPEDTEFSAEIREYISQVLKEEGILKPFDVLRFAFSQDASGKVDLAYADDPEMYSAIYSMQQEKTGELRTVYLENMTALMGQLKVLPLSHGSTDVVVNQLQQIVSNAGKEKQ
jgi:hypothetical protein